MSIKKDKPKAFLGQLMHLATIILSKINQAHKFRYHITPFVWEIWSIDKEWNGKKILGSRKKLFKWEGEQETEQVWRNEKKCLVNEEGKKGWGKRRKGQKRFHMCYEHVHVSMMNIIITHSKYAVIKIKYEKMACTSKIWLMEHNM